MINKNLLILLFLFLNDTIVAQPNSFFTTHGGDGLDHATELANINSGYFIFTGFTENPGELYDNIWLVKTDNEGTLLWQKTFGGNYRDIGYDVISTSDDGILLCGNLGRFDPFGGWVGDAYAVKTDSEGDTLWTFLWAVGLESRASFEAVTELSDGTYVLAGTTDAELNGGPPRSILIALDSEGNQLWEREYESYSYTTTMIPTQTEGYCIAGFYGSLGGFVQPLLINTDSQGDTLWTRRGVELGVGIATITDVVQDEEGNYLV